MSSITGDVLPILSGGTGNTAGGDGSGSLPAGVIVMWAGLLSAIPDGWNLCDGNNGTPDLRERFIKGAAAGINPGATGGSATHTPTGTVSQPTFAGDALSTHSHGTGTYATSAHSGTAVADHAAHTHSVTSNVTVDNHASHTHTYTEVPNHVHVQSVNSGTTGGLSGYTPDTSTSTSTSSGYSTANPTGGVATGTTNGPGAALTHTVNNNAVTSGNPSATLTHSVTQPSAHTLSGSSSAVSAGTPAGTVSQPTFTGDSQNTEPVYFSLAFIQKA
jgi:hypothetical protein